MSDFRALRRHLTRRFVVSALVVTLGSAALVGCTDSPTYRLADCDPKPRDHSAARIWNEHLLDAIRRDLPSPTVHARNLFHLSAAMWDAWAAHHDGATGVFIDTEATDSAVEDTISYAAARILSARYERSLGAFETITAIEDEMIARCLDLSYTTSDGASAADLGNRIAQAILVAALDDGSNEQNGYIDPTYAPVNQPLVVAEPGVEMIEPDRWQPLALENRVAQNGIPLDDELQEFIGSQWGSVLGFAIEASADALPIDPGPPPGFGTVDFVEQVVDVIAASGQLDPADGAVIDIGPATIGNNTLGRNDGSGRDRNPITGGPYEPNLLHAGDYYRVVAEFWADGPESETPPGHWNTIANAVSDELAQTTAEQGVTADRLQWDVELYLALNGALHDAAIAAWGAKRTYDYVRPVSSVRYLAALGQSSDPDLPRYDVDGLPILPGVIEVITAESSAPGERHAHLADHAGEIALRAWTGAFTDDEPQVDWIRGAEWVPYQRPTFVTPAFAAYVSGHSTFSRAAAEILAAYTGSEYFPGGLGEWVVPAGSLDFDDGPATDVTLQWATYFDASDQSGLSRIYGGIHIAADDVAGRIMGSEIGAAAWEKASALFPR